MNEQIIAVDFDGTLCENKWPEIGEPNTNLIGYLIEMRKSFGAKIILWTCRVGEMLDKAVNWCSEHRLEFDAVNENLPLADNLKYGEKVAEGFKKGVSEVSEKPNRKKPAGKNSEKHLDDRKEFLRVFRQLTYRHRSWDIWSDFIIMFACALSNPVDKDHFDEREALYLRAIKKYNKQEQPLFSELAAYTVAALEENQEQDFLGSIYTELGLNSKEHEQIFTPYHVCELMAEITMKDIVEKVKKDGYITLNDPCCGAGATLIAGIHAARKRLEKANLNYQNHILVAAQDIDMVVALMCYIQLSLLGVAAYIKVGNSLTEPMTENDSLDNYWFTMMYFSDIWSMRRLLRSL